MKLEPAGMTMDGIGLNELSMALSLADTFLSRASALLDGIPLGRSIQERYSSLYWQLSLEDGYAITLLVRNRHVQSARALVRPQIDALLRGAWFAVLASENEARSAIERDEVPKSGEIRKRFKDSMTEWRIGVDLVPLHDLFNPTLIEALHDHTHRGTRALGRTAEARLVGGKIFADDEIQLIWMSIGSARIATAAILQQCGAENRALDLHSLCCDVMPKLRALLLLEQQPDQRQ